MKKIIVTVTAIAILAPAGIANASGPRACDIEGTCEPDPIVTCDPYGPQPVPVECRDDDIPPREGQVFPERIPAANVDQPEPVQFQEPSQLPNTGTAEWSILLGSLALFGLYLIAKKAYQDYRKKLNEAKEAGY